jgi:GT2 family glycosyltransferase
MAIAAIVVSHSDPERVAATLEAVDAQTVKPDLCIVVGSFTPGTLADHWLQVSTPAGNSNSALITAAIDALPFGFAQAPDAWIWVLTEDTIPEPAALGELVKIIEVAPSAAMIAPKLVRLDSPRIIEQMGLTLTKRWRVFSSVSTEFDQSQHDEVQDVLAVPVAAALLSAQKYLEHLGIRKQLTPLAGDYDLAMRFRLNGARVLMAPNARVRVASSATQLVLAQQSNLELRKAQVELFSNYAPFTLALILGLFAPAIALIQSVWLLLVKRPERIVTELATGFWWFFTLPARLGQRSGISSAERSGVRQLRALFASREDISRAQRSKVEQPAARAELEAAFAQNKPKFVASAGLWIMVALAAVSYKFWPTDIAVTGGQLLPLGADLGHIFGRAGSAWQQLGLGMAAPSDPFNWVLLGLASITAWAPSLSIALLVFLAKPLAFAGAWRALNLATNKVGLLTLGALAYALWPALTVAQTQGRFGTLLALLLLPWFVFTIARVLELGSNQQRSVQTWTWVGLSSLLAAAISASAPSLAPLVALFILLLAIYRFKRIGYLIWIPIPLLVLWIPQATYLGVGLAQPLALLTDPGVPVASAKQPLWQLLLGSHASLVFGGYTIFGVGLVLAIGLFAVFTKRTFTALWLWVAALASVVCAWLLTQVSFQADGAVAESTGRAWVNGSGYALLGLAGLLFIYLAVIALDSGAGLWSRVGKSVTWILVWVLAAQFAISANQLTWSNGQQVPALVQAQTQSNPQTRTLLLRSLPSYGNSQNYSATVITGDGIHLENLSNSYRYSLAKLTEQNPAYRQLSQLTANLISANGSDVNTGLKAAGINYILVLNQPGLNTSTTTADLAASLDTVQELESVGVTEYGRLWRVTQKITPVSVEGSSWSITKTVQVIVLALFALLALPTRRRAKRFGGNDELAPESDLFEQEATV